MSCEQTFWRFLDMYRHPDRQTSKVCFVKKFNLSSDLFFLPGIAPASAPAIASIMASPAPPLNGMFINFKVEDF